MPACRACRTWRARGDRGDGGHAAAALGRGGSDGTHGQLRRAGRRLHGRWRLQRRRRWLPLLGAVASTLQAERTIRCRRWLLWAATRWAAAVAVAAVAVAVAVAQRRWAMAAPWAVREAWSTSTACPWWPATRRRSMLTTRGCGSSSHRSSSRCGSVNAQGERILTPSSEEMRQRVYEARRRERRATRATFAAAPLTTGSSSRCTCRSTTARCRCRELGSCGSRGCTASSRRTRSAAGARSAARRSAPTARRCSTRCSCWRGTTAQAHGGRAAVRVRAAVYASPPTTATRMPRFACAAPTRARSSGARCAATSLGWRAWTAARARPSTSSLC